MERDLNLFELTIVKEVLAFNRGKYPFFEKHLSYLRVTSLEKTGVGVYVNFKDAYGEDLICLDVKKHIVLTSTKTLDIDILDWELNYELNITDGKIDFLELVANDELWDGSYEGFVLNNPLI